MCFVIGEAGAGKTRLVTESLGHLSGDRISLVQAYCDEIGTDRSFSVFTELLGDYRKRMNGNSAIEVAEEHARRLAWIDPGFSSVPNPADSEAKTEISHREQKQERLILDSLRVFFAQLAERTTVVIRIEDLQYADRWSLEALRVLRGHLEGRRITIICEIRGLIGAIPHEIVDLLSTLNHHGSIECIFLDGLSVEQTWEIARSHLRRPLSQELVEELHRLSGGNPLFVTQLLRSAQWRSLSDAKTAIYSHAKGTIPGNVQALIASRLAEVPEVSLDVLRAAALIGYRFRLNLLARVLESYRADELDAALESLMRSGLVAAILDAPECRFAHDLVRESVVATMPRLRAQELHGRIADALAELNGSAGNQFAADILRHLESAGSDDADWMALLALQAGKTAFERLSFYEAIAHFEKTIRLWADEGEPGTLAEIHFLLSRCYMHTQTRQGERIASREHLQLAIGSDWSPEGLRRIQTNIRTSEICLLAKFGELTDMPLFEKLVEALPQDPQVRLLYSRAELLRSGEPSRVITIVEEARRLAVEVGDLPAELQACEYLALWFHLQGDTERCRKAALRQIEIAERLRNRRMQASGRNWVRQCLEILGQPDEADKWERQLVSWVHDSRDPELIAWSIAYIECGRAMKELDVTQIRSVMEAFERVAYAFEGCADNLEPGYAEEHIALLSGDIDGIRRTVEKLSGRPHSFRSIEILIVLAVILDSREIASQLEEIARLDTSAWNAGIAQRVLWHELSGLGVASVLLGKPEDAREYAGRIPADIADTGWERVGILANLVGDHEQAIERTSHCLDRVGHDGPLNFTACILHADSQLALGERDARYRGTAVLVDCLAIAKEKGLPLFERFIQQVASRHGCSIGEEGSTGSPRFIANLTPRETQVLRHVANGELNKEISAELNISVRTVHRHIENILRKTGCGNRTEATRFAVEHGLVSARPESH